MLDQDPVPVERTSGHWRHPGTSRSSTARMKSGPVYTNVDDEPCSVQQAGQAVARCDGCGRQRAAGTHVAWADLVVDQEPDHVRDGRHVGDGRGINWMCIKIEAEAGLCLD